MKKIFPLVLMLLSFLSSKAQYEIPDSNFRKILALNYNCIVDGKLDTIKALFRTELDITSQNITSLEGIGYFKNLKILNCAKNQLTSLPSLPGSLTQLTCNNNQLTSLPSLPGSLTSLVCYNNQLTALPSLPGSLYSLFCGDNQLTSLPSLPGSLNYLNCIGNKQLTSLPSLPGSLTKLVCYSNQLTSLPSLPGSLRTLDCRYNQLTSLPNLPDSLTELYFYNNQLTSLPPLPGSLTSLDCYNNQLTSLPSLPSSLTKLNCYNNQLTSLPSLPSSLSELNCYNNQLTSLPSLPGSLRSLDCRYNQLTSLPNLPDSLRSLDCSSNQLTSLPSLPGSLRSLDCSSNQLTSLPSLPESLFSLNCRNNQLTSLPNLPASLYYLYCSYNLISTIQALPLYLISLEINNNPINCLPTLPSSLDYLYISNTFLTCLSRNDMEYQLDIQLPVCTNSDQICPSSAIKFGYVYIDANNNNTKDNNEKALPSSQLKVAPKNYILTSNKNGYYTALLEKNVSNTWNVTTTFPYGTIVPANYSSTPATPGTDSISYDFGLQLRPNIPDLEVAVASGPARPGFVNNFTATIHNRGTINQTGITLKIKKPDELTFISAEPAPNSSVGDTIVWNNLALTLFESKTFNIQFQVPATADLLGTPLNYKAIVSPISIDSTPANNIAPWTETVRGSYDPNDKLVNSQNLSPSYTSKDKLLYTIRFQNTGTDTAFTVIVRDELPDNLDASSVRMVNSSHPCAFLARKKNILEFVFSNILLVDSATNEPKSHGFVQLEVKPIKGLLIDDSIKNNASIFFDYNKPIITPNALTVVKEISTGIASNKNLFFSIYPNPSKSNFTVALPNEKGSAVWMLTDISGRTVKSGMVNNLGKTLEISVADVSSGTYIFSLQMNGEISSAKVMIVK